MLFDQPPEPIILNAEIIIQSIVDIHPREAARQLTLLTWNLYFQISPREFLDLRWTDKEDPSKAPNIKAMIHRFNCISDFVVREIVKPKDIHDRVSALAHWIAIAQVCFDFLVYFFVYFCPVLFFNDITFFSV